MGKTTTAINLAAAFARRGTKTLIVDTDPQGSVRFGLGLHSAADRYGLSDYVEGTRQMREIVRPTALPWLRAVLAGTVAEGGSHDDYHRRVTESEGISDLLQRAADRGYLVIVDTPPGLGPIVHRVLAASQNVIVPLQCEPLALQTTTQILRGIKGVVTTENQQLTFDGILLTMFEPGNAIAERVAAYLRQQLPKDMVFETPIPRTTASIEAFAAGQPVVLRTPADPAARAYVSVAERLATTLQI